jgi:hypothetical protein
VDPCIKEWNGRAINCCVKGHPGPDCKPEACAKTGGTCQRDPCGHPRCVVGRK